MSPDAPSSPDRRDAAPWTWTRSEGCVLATAIHDGHEVRPDVRALLRLPDADRLREEDPHTRRFTAVADQRVVVHRSRFEVDLNRPRDRAVYRVPEDAWGLDVWSRPVPDDVVSQSLSLWDTFYAEVEATCRPIVEEHGAVLVFDLHSYNHRRGGPSAPPDSPEGNPEVNVGTGSLDRARWAPVVDQLLEEFGAVEWAGRRLDVRENVRFRGGNLSTFVNGAFPSRGCALAIEFKKIFMDEWSGAVDEEALSVLVAGWERVVGRLRKTFESML